MIISMVAAVGKNRELGKDNKLLWHIPEDLKRFKDLTSGHVVIMGRKTFESIGRPLPNRTNIVISRDENFKAPDGIIICASIDSALAEAKKTNIPYSPSPALGEGPDLSGDEGEIFVIGGGKIYEQFLPYTDRLYLTLVDKEYEADTFFPPFDEFNKIISEKDGEYEGLKYKYLTLEK